MVSHYAVDVTLLNVMYIREVYNDFNVLFEGKTALPFVHFFTCSFHSNSR